MITEKEQECLDLSAELYNKINKLSKEPIEGGGVNDMAEVVYQIHSIQNYLLSRSTLREIRNK